MDASEATFRVTIRFVGSKNDIYLVGTSAESLAKWETHMEDGIPFKITTDSQDKTYMVNPAQITYIHATLMEE